MSDQRLEWKEKVRFVSRIAGSVLVVFTLSVIVFPLVIRLGAFAAGFSLGKMGRELALVMGVFAGLIGGVIVGVVVGDEDF